MGEVRVEFSVARFVLIPGLCISIVGCGGGQQANGPVTKEYTQGQVVTNSLSRAKNKPATEADQGSSRRAPQPYNTGLPVSAADYPWQIGLFVDADGHGKGWRCGGILISPDFVLTAAHCVDAASETDYGAINRIKPAYIDVYQGREVYASGPALTVAAVAIHPNWKTDPSKPFAYDAALLRLQTPLHGPTPAPIQRASKSSGEAVVSGWGRFDSTDQPSDVLRAVALPLVDNATCQNHLPQEKRQFVHDAALCTESARNDACKGDSGGPLVIGSRSHPQTIGVVSWGPDGRCAYRGPRGTLIGGYTRASAIAPWVLSASGDVRTVTDSAPQTLFDVFPLGNGRGPDR